jgi:hypothetical protein
MDATPNESAYTIERYTAEIDAAAYIRDFHDADFFIKFCQQCGNYGRRYGCPQGFDFYTESAKKLNQIEYFCTTIAISKQKRLQL